jgi:hypothetical protein
MSFCARGNFWEKEPHTHSPPPPPPKCGRCVQQDEHEKIELELDDSKSESSEEEESEEEEETHTLVLRRSVRDKRKPERYSPPDFHSNFSLSITNDDPKTVREAVNSEDIKL